MTHVLGDMKNLKCLVFLINIIIQYNGDKIYAISEINISGKYLRLKKRYLKSLSISIQQHTTLRFNKIIISMFSYLTCLSNSKDILLSEDLSVSILFSDQNKKSWYSTILSF